MSAQTGTTESTNGQVTGNTTAAQASQFPLPNEPPPAYTPTEPPLGSSYSPSSQMQTYHKVVPAVGQKSTTLVCPACHTEILTKTKFSPSMRTHLMALLLCVLGCWCCCCIPYCCQSCNNTEHQCPNCDVYIGTYRA